MHDTSPGLYTGMAILFSYVITPCVETLQLTFSRCLQTNNKLPTFIKCCDVCILVGMPFPEHLLVLEKIKSLDRVLVCIFHTQRVHPHNWDVHADIV